MTERLRRELASAARRLGLTDEVVGRLASVFEVAYKAGWDAASLAHEKPQPVAKVPKGGVK